MYAGIRAIEYALPERRMTLAELEAAGLLESGAARLAEFGFACAHVSDRPAEALAHDAVARLLERHAVDPESVDALFYAGALPSSHTAANGNGDFLSGFHYPACKLQYDFGLRRATVAGVSQAGCLGLMSAVKMAADFLTANPEARRALCLSADVLPAGARREILYNVISDGACAALVERDAPRNRILAWRQVTKGYYWDCSARKNEIVAAYFPTARNVAREALAAAGISPRELACIVPHNVSLRSWEVLLGLLEVPREKLFAENIAARGHVIAADTLMNLRDAAERGRLRRGDRVLLFNFGFGANWCGMVVEH